jgi:hypothetical protein
VRLRCYRSFIGHDGWVIRKSVVALACVGLLGAACGGDDAQVAVTIASATTTTTALTTTAAPTPVTTAPSTAPPTTIAAPTTTTEPEFSGLVSAEEAFGGYDFRNSTWKLIDLGLGEPGDEIEVVDGEFSRGEAFSEDALTVLIDEPLYGFFGPNDQPAAAVPTLFNTGGTGQFTDVIVFLMGADGPAAIASAGAGDRADGGIYDVSIVDDELVIGRFGMAQGACCPTAVETTSFEVGDDGLTPTGPTLVQAYIAMDNGESSPSMVQLQFIPGTSSAVVFGDGLAGSVLTFEASAGQTLTIDMRPSIEEVSSATLTLIDEFGTIIGEVRTFEVLSLELPGDGLYTLEASAPDAPADSFAGFEAIVEIV